MQDIHYKNNNYYFRCIELNKETYYYVFSTYNTHDNCISAPIVHNLKKKKKSMKY